MDDTGFLIIIILLGAALVVVSFVMLNIVKGLKVSIGRMEQKVEGLQADLLVQQQNLDAVRAVLQKKPDDPFAQVLQAVDRYRSRGLLPAVAMVGLRLFRSYLSGKVRKKALPVLDKKYEVKK